MSTDLPKILDSLESLNQLERYCGATQDANFIFRGTNKKYSIKRDGVNSSLYRWGNTAKLKLFAEHYRPPDMEEEIVEKARRLLFKGTTNNRKILTKLQHLRGRTNLIDFSRSHYVALFFACDGNFKKNGELILLDTNGMETLEKIDYNNLQELALVQPGTTKLIKKRVIVQQSVFVYAQKGYIEQGKYITVPVSKKFKKDFLKYLRKSEGLCADKVYRDPMGFVENERNYETALVHFNRGNAYVKKAKYDSAIKSYCKAIGLKSDYASAYNNRGNAYMQKGNYDVAIADCSKALVLEPKYAGAHNNRGIAYRFMDEYDSAILDCTKAIDYKPDYAEAYFNRGDAYRLMGEYDLAIDDYTEAISLKQNFVEAYNNRGNAYLKKGEPNLAIVDYNRALKLKPDYAEAYYNRGILFLIQKQWDSAKSDLSRAQEKGSDIVAEFKDEFRTLDIFENKYKIKVPDEIAKMLGGISPVL